MLSENTKFNLFNSIARWHDMQRIIIQDYLYCLYIALLYSKEYYIKIVVEYKGYTATVCWVSLGTEAPGQSNGFCDIKGSIYRLIS